jgi:murein DD-endopeptidase MepM/ murein hydrolase activator NlpD
MDALMALNDLKRNSILKIGREISIPDSGNNIHLIKAGETLWDIAASAGISVEELKKYNPGQDPDTLRIGDILKLPGGTRLVASQSSRGVKYADFLLNWPLAGTITSYFGWRSQGFHYGLDIAAASGKNIRAAAAGVVTYAGWKGNYGKAVMIRHEDGRETLYGHMQSIKVNNGQNVNRGQIIGLVGSTGHSTGPHVHFEVRKNGICCNPMKYLR